MFFSRKKDTNNSTSEATPTPSARNKPPVPPKRGIFHFGKPREESGALKMNATLSETHIMSHKLEESREPSVLVSETTTTTYSNKNGFEDQSAYVNHEISNTPKRKTESRKVAGSPKELDIQGLSLPALASVQVYVRRITLRKNVNGDFGFSIRRVQFPYGNNGELRTIVFAEPSEMRPGPPRPEQLRTGLLPGDQLLEIDGKTVEKMNRDELQETVRSAEQSIVLLVKAVPELAEICMKREAAGDQLMLENVNTSLREDVRDDERYWLIHKGGYSLTRLLGHQDDGKVRIAIGGKELIVDSTDVDRANPEVVDRISDLASLRYLNETSAVHVLRNRYGSNLLYTNGGSQSLIALSTNEPSSSERLVHLFKGCRRGQMPAHVYATAQQVYRNLQMTAQNQNIILTGVTGSGKTTQLRALSEYLASVAGWTKVLTYDRLSSIFGILEALGHASTKFHRDSTRFVKLFGLGFDRAAALKSARIQACLLECDRVMFQSTSDDAESNFHIFYYFYEGVDQSEFERLKLASIDSSVLKGYKNEEDKQRARETWTRFEKALIDNDFEEERVIAVKNVLAAILHLRTAGSTPGSAQRAHFIKASHAQIAADLLGVSVESLTQAAFRGKSATTTTTSTSSLNRFSFTSRGCDGPEALISFGGSLYQELFQSVVDHLNRSLASNSACSWISIFDFPGLTSASSQPCGLNDLVMNYVNERVAELFHDISFVEPQEVYSREQVDVAVEIPLKTPHSLTRLFDEKQHLLTSTDIEKRAVERRGLFAILDEEAMFPGASDDSLLERIFMHLGDDTRLMRRGGKHRQLVIAHGLETQPVTYDLSGWVKQAQPCESAGSVKPLLMKSNLSPIQAMLSTTLSTTSEASRLRRATQAAQLELQAKKAAGGFVANLNGQLDYVFSSLRRARRSCFVHCVQPQSTNNMNIITTTIYQKDIVDVPYVRSQLRSMNIIDSIRANNRGFPERVSFRDFRRRFGCLADESDASLMQTLDDRAAVSAILEKSDVPGHRYRLGISQILLTPEVLNELEDRRELCLSGLIASFQQQCRRHLSSKWMQKRRALETAIRCIQKNGKNYVTVREWSWWRLYARVVPLLAVARADTETREWEVKVRKLEQQISELRVAKTKAEGKAAELESEADRQSHAAAEMSVALEAETQSRVQLERRLQHMTEAAGDTVSRSPSMAKLESAPSDSRMAELRQELAKAKESEEAMRVKTQKAVSQLQDVEAELCDVKARNEILEKKQQRFDVDLTAVETQLKEARLSSEKIQKEKDEQSASVSRKLEELQTLKSENAELRVVISRLKRDAEERVEQSGGADELTQLQMTRRNLETKIREQEDEIDELTETNSIQQQAITRLEMSQERLKNELQREIANRESEIDELRGQYQRRLRNLEDQLADSQEANSQLAKENRVLEARSSQSHMASYQSSLDISGGQAKRELKKALALLHDTQCLLAHERENAPSQALIRQLKEQLEDAEAAKLSALKGRHGLESELNEVRAQLEQTLVAKSAAEDKAMALLKEKNGCAGLIVEKDEQLLNLLKKYKCAIQQNHLDHIAIADQSEQIADLERAKVKLQEELHEQMSQNEFLRQSTVEKHKLLLSEHRCKELDAKLELESAHRLRLEANVIRSTEEVELLQDQLTEANTSRDKETEATRKLRKEVLQLQDVIEDYKKRDAESSHKARQVRDELDQIEERNKVLQAEVKLSQRRIDNLQAALNDDLDEDGSEDEFETMEEEDERAGMNIL